MVTTFTCVLFRSSSNKLVNIYPQYFTSVKDAKRIIEGDAKLWFSKHGKIAGEWIAPKAKDYYMAMGKDGETCIWQYFTIHMQA